MHFTHCLRVAFDLSVEIASGFVVCENMCSAERHNVLLRSVHVCSVALRDRISCIAVLNENDNPVDSAIGSNDGFHNEAPSEADDSARKSCGLECCGHIRSGGGLIHVDQFLRCRSSGSADERDVRVESSKVTSGHNVIAALPETPML